MRRWCLLGLAACYAPSPPAGVPCVPGEDVCPDGQVCASVAGVFECTAPGGDVDAPTDSPDPDADADGDGVRDADDNCPAVANADQANDDLDRFGDACDPCPPFADPEPLDDADGDHVSGACDPFPAMAGDRIAVFESFNGPTRPAGWTQVGNNWTFAGGQAVVASGDGDLNYLTIVQPAAARQMVMTRFTIDQITGVGERAIGPAQLFQPSPLRSIACELLRNGNGAQLTIDDTDGPTLAIGTSTFDENQTAVMTNVRAGKQYTCNDGAVTLTASTDYTTAMPAFGVRTHSVSAHVDWVLVTASP